MDNNCDKLNSAVNISGIEKLCSYIPFFETATRESICQWSGDEKLGENNYIMHSPEYVPAMYEFIEEVYKANLISFDYLNITNGRGIDSADEMISAINTADLNLVRAILTGYIRQERFCDGLWASAVEDKVFLKILKRLQQLNTLKLGGR